MKRFFYRDTPENFIILGIIIISALLKGVLGEKIFWGIFLVCIMLYIIYIIWNYKINAGKRFFQCKHSIITHKAVWIVQKEFVSKDNDNCPQYKLAKEMKRLLRDIPVGTVCYCCTHEVIKEHILKIYPNVEVTPIYKKNLKILKRIIKTKRCKYCTIKGCSMFKDEEVQFYTLKFII